MRHSTARKREELQKRQREREEKRLKMRKNKSTPSLDEQVAEYRRLTQEELLAEAKITEKINIASLGLTILHIFVKNFKLKHFQIFFLYCF